VHGTTADVARLWLDFTDTPSEVLPVGVHANPAADGNVEGAAEGQT
jgi:hypothetical protein